MRTLQNIILFFRDPKKLFATLKEKPDLKGSFIILVSIIFVYQLVGISIGHIEITHIVSGFFALTFTFFLMLAGFCFVLICESFYILLICKILGRKLNFKLILSSIIYCTIPVILGNIAYLVYRVNLNLYSLFSNNDLSPFFMNFYKRVGIFELWINIMEIIAIKIIADLNYKKSIIIVTSLFLISIMLTYFLRLKVPY